MPASKTFFLKDASAQGVRKKIRQAALEEKICLHKDFENLRGISGAYFRRNGMRELGWTPDRVFASLVSRFPGEHYLSWGRVVYGVAPTVLSLGLLTLAGWFWSRAGGPATLGTYVQRAFLGVVGLVVLFWIGLIVIAHLQGGFPSVPQQYKLHRLGDTGEARLRHPSLGVPNMQPVGSCPRIGAEVLT